MARRHLQDKRIILTGASSGVGRSLARQLAKHNSKLILNARRLDRLQTLATEIRDDGGVCEVVVGDITEPTVRQQVLTRSLDHFGGLDCLLNNAGIGAMGSFADATAERLRKIFEVNFFSVTEMTRLCLPHLQKGHDPLIVNMGSVLGHRAAPLKSEYCASKFAIHGFSDALRAELVSSPIGVLLISPSTIDSEFFDSAIEDATGRNWKSPAAMAPDAVARKIVSAMIKRKHEIILPVSGKMLVWLDRLFPSLAHRIVARFGQ